MNEIDKHIEYRIVTGWLCLLTTLLLSGTAWSQAVPNSDKLTPAAKAVASSLAAGERHKYWLYLDPAVAASSAIELSDKALARRAKVDPANFLIDNRDFPIADSILRVMEASGLSVKFASRWFKAVVVEADWSGLSKAVALPFVSTVDPVRTLTRQRDDDLDYPKPSLPRIQTIDFAYGFSEFQNRFIKAVRPHWLGYTGQGVRIAIFDTGFNTAHRSFDSTHIVATYDFINDDLGVDDPECPSASSTDQTSHGTAVLSVIGGYDPDTLIGVAPGAEFALAKTEITCDGAEIKIEEYNWIAAAEWADTLGVDIINSSVGYTEFTDSGSYTFDDLDGNTALITVAADIAASKNILVVSSAGNYRTRSWGHIGTPADGDSVLAVGAVNPDSSLASFSSPGPTSDNRIKPDITTLGVGVFVASHLGGYKYSNGTSFSSPLTAGGAALALERDPALSARELLERIRRTGNRSDNPDNDFGYGLFDATRSANLFISFDLPEILQVKYDHPETFDVSIQNWDGPTPLLSSVDLPEWMEFFDNGDGTGILEVNADAESPPSLIFGLAAAVTEFADTSYFELQVFGDVASTATNSPQAVSAGPNPFSESVRIFVGEAAGEVKSISIFNTAGEIVWEQVNNFLPTADATYGLQQLWDGRNLDGEAVAAGVYIVVVITDRQTYQFKLLKTN
ncbi:MAG: S8 family peptidase [Candidatus Zixiibacteriota bacterium]|nr:MAG: S8 family peptidase [candidate division Zixibacteria bacterium]